MQATGRLDLSGRAYGDAINDGLGAFLKSNDVKQLFLCSNKISAVPPALWLGQELKLLDLSGNSLGIDYLSDDLSLPTLQELNMSRCNIVTFEPLLTHLRAPCLQTLNVAINRLTGALPILRQVYPALTTFLANDNKVVALNAESLRGLHVVNLSGNNIDQLPAEVGLLWDDGLRSLEISGNTFRVPSYRVLEKGTEAVLKYLRDKLPEAQRVAAANGLADAGT
jgi:Leucine-rich repeat (LRR) protein